MAFADKLGSSYAGVKDQVKIKTVNIKVGEASFDLKVRILLKREMEDLVAQISTPEPERVKAIYEKFAEPIRKSIDEGGEDFLKSINAEKQMIAVTDDDIILDGSSIKSVANYTAMWEVKVEKYFGLLQSETGEPITESFAQISEEFPESVIKLIIDEIDNVIKPTYKDVKKN
ncbi:hypothetical protein UFOVP263_50 [uncultured Caudovirales phage]|uniref:Uncharacterized protein n=1 Tax=uncultured Caudovirales phage TaxID=2100421 RepID=A0A6J5LH25_9CAUD|nr:hypothetical protein UFOVP263_50 [uncultured Caudovirales phage]CAB4242005.1 hypothetical protein UFOVP91_12 [uncultured Caudovirales phage]